MEGYGVGMMARSLAGHDKGKVYMVLDVNTQNGRKASEETPELFFG